MKIAEVHVYPLYIPLRESPPVTPLGKLGSSHILIKIIADNGIVGYGETFGFTPRTMSMFIDEILKPLLIGQDPTQIESLWHLMYSATFAYGRMGLPLHAISGIEIALWDILGKYRGLPIYEMLGGACRDRVRAYASMHTYDTPEDVATIALRCIEEGYSAVKLHQRDIQSVVSARQAIGPDVPLMLDVNGAWSLSDALTKSRQLEKSDVYWLEEPLARMEDYESLANLRQKTHIPIAAGENEYTVYGFQHIVDKRAVDVLQPDVVKAGGISQCCKIFALAEANNVRVATHSFYHGPGMAATLHLCISSPHTEFIEVMALPLTHSFIQPALRPEMGFLNITDGPGLGIEIDDDVVKAHLRKW